MSNFNQEYFKNRKWSRTPKRIVDDVISELEIIVREKLHKNLSQISILDVGSGTGEYSISLAKRCKKVVGVEPYKTAYLRAIANKKRAKSKVTFINKPVEDINLRTKFDLAISLTTIEHMPEAEKSYKNVFKLLKKGGILYLTAPNKLWPYENHYNLYFLSWLPLSFANLYVKALKRGINYEDSAFSRTYFGMRHLFSQYSCSYRFVLPRNPNSGYIGCGDISGSYQLMKLIGLYLLPKAPFLWIFSKGFIMEIQKK